MTRLSLTRRALAVALPVILNTQAPASNAAAVQTWRLLNGEVSLPVPIACDGVELRDPVLVGSGSSGAVFAVRASAPHPPVAVLKVGWEGRAQASIENERRVLQHLNRADVPGVETVLAACSPAGGAGSSRTALLLSPLVEDPVERIEEINGDDAQRRAAVCLAETVVRILAARVATLDVQLLADRRTGTPLLVDFTEARIFPRGRELGSTDVALVGSFVSEMDALIPQGELQRLFSTRIKQALKEYPLDPELQDVAVAGFGL